MLDWKHKLGLALTVAAVCAALFALRLLQPVSTCVTGSAAARAQAAVPEPLRDRHLDAGDMQVGLGTAAIGGWESLGDALAVGGRVWLRTTHKRSPRYYRVVANRYFQSNYFVHVPAGRAPAGSLSIPADTALGALADNLARRYPAGVMAAGYTRFDTLASIAIAEPAVNGEPIARHAARYYTRPMEAHRNAWTYTVLLTAPASATHSDEGKLLFQATEKNAARPLLVHALRLNGEPPDRQRPPGDAHVAGLGQVLGESVLAEGELALYPITRLGACAESTTHQPPP